MRHEISGYLASSAKVLEHLKTENVWWKKNKQKKKNQTNKQKKNQEIKSNWLYDSALLNQSII